MFTKSRLLDEELSSNSGKLVRKSLSRAMLLRRRMEVERLLSLASIESFSMSEIRRCVEVRPERYDVPNIASPGDPQDVSRDLKTYRASPHVENQAM